MKRTPIKRSARRESSVERDARQEFNRVVLAGACSFRGRRGCEYCNGPYGHAHGVDICPSCGGDNDHRCSGRKDSHHLVEQQWLKRNYSDLREDMLLTICFDPRIGVPLCRAAHEAVTARRERIYWHELPEEAREFAADIDQLYLRFPLPWGGQRQSLVTRLKLECPEMEKAAT